MSESDDTIEIPWREQQHRWLWRQQWREGQKPFPIPLPSPRCRQRQRRRQGPSRGRVKPSWGEAQCRMAPQRGGPPGVEGPPTSMQFSSGTRLYIAYTELPSQSCLILHSFSFIIGTSKYSLTIKTVIFKLDSGHGTTDWYLFTLYCISTLYRILTELYSFILNLNITSFLQSSLLSRTLYCMTLCLYVCIKAAY